MLKKEKFFKNLSLEARKSAYVIRPYGTEGDIVYKKWYPCEILRFVDLFYYFCRDMYSR